MRARRDTFLLTNPIRGWPKVLAAVLLLACLSAPAQAQRGAQTRPRALDQLAQEAELIVRGQVVSTRVEPHPQLKNLMTVVVSMDVQETLKGRSQKRIQFRQYIWDIRDQLDAAKYLKGENLILMLGPVSPYGLTSPVGLEQGRFRVQRDSSGQPVAVNGRGNLGLFAATEQRARAQGLTLPPRTAALVRQAHPGPVRLADLEEAIRTFAKAK